MPNCKTNQLLRIPKVWINMKQKPPKHMLLTSIGPHNTWAGSKSLIALNKCSFYMGTWYSSTPLENNVKLGLNGIYSSDIQGAHKNHRTKKTQNLPIEMNSLLLRNCAVLVWGVVIIDGAYSGSCHRSIRYFTEYFFQ